jgi:hypothetical protein
MLFAFLWLIACFAGEEGAEVQSATKQMLSRLNSIRRNQENHGHMMRAQHNLLLHVDGKMGVMLRAMRMQSRMVMELLLEEEAFPSLVIFLPPRPPNGALLKRFPEWVANPKRLFAHEVRLYFVCSVSMAVAPTNGGEGFPITIEREWLRKAAPFLRAGLMVFRTAVAAGRAAGIPVPGLEEGIVQVLDALKSAVNAELAELTVDGQEMGEMFDKISEYASEQAAKVGPESSHGTDSLFNSSGAMTVALRQELKRSAESLHELLSGHPEWHARSGLRKSYCADDEQVVWCLPEYEAQINRETKASIAQMWHAPAASLTKHVDSDTHTPEQLAHRGSAEGVGAASVPEIQNMREAMDNLTLQLQLLQERDTGDQGTPVLTADRVQSIVSQQLNQQYNTLQKSIEAGGEELRQKVGSISNVVNALHMDDLRRQVASISSAIQQSANSSAPAMMQGGVPTMGTTIVRNADLLSSPRGVGEAVSIASPAATEPAMVSSLTNYVESGTPPQEELLHRGSAEGVAAESVSPFPPVQTEIQNMREAIDNLTMQLQLLKERDTGEQGTPDLIADRVQSIVSQQLNQVYKYIKKSAHDEELRGKVDGVCNAIDSALHLLRLHEVCDSDNEVLSPAAIADQMQTIVKNQNNQLFKTLHKSFQAGACDEELRQKIDSIFRAITTDGDLRQQVASISSAVQQLANSSAPAMMPGGVSTFGTTIAQDADLLSPPRGLGDAVSMARPPATEPATGSRGSLAWGETSNSHESEEEEPATVRAGPMKKLSKCILQ